MNFGFHDAFTAAVCTVNSELDGPAAEIDAHEIGLSILGPLRELDEVAYLRFASVYQAFESLDDFDEAIQALRTERAAAATAAEADPES